MCKLAYGTVNKLALVKNTENIIGNSLEILAKDRGSHN